MSDFPITPEILINEIGMTKIGHRTKFFQKIEKELCKIPGGASKIAPKQPDKSIMENCKRLEACKECTLM
jgi:hypothetical protein